MVELYAFGFKSPLTGKWAKPATPCLTPASTMLTM
jgi:hypothetical protein